MPAIFCRDPRPSRWNPAEPASPHPDYTLREFYVRVLTQALPPVLEGLLVKRFLPRPDYLSPHSETPPALPSLTRRGFAPGELPALSDQRLCQEITIEANLFDRTLIAPEGLMSGLSRYHLLVVHLTRMRQLWEEFARRRWPEGWLPAYRKALG